MFGTHYHLPVNFAFLNVLGTALKRLISVVFSFVIFYLCDRICAQRLFYYTCYGQLLVFLSDLAVLLF